MCVYTRLTPSPQDYFTIVKEPMDLATIDRKLSNGLYSNPWEVCVCGCVCVGVWVGGWVGGVCVGGVSSFVSASYVHVFLVPSSVRTFG